MATTTDNYELILPSGEDRVNPLTQVNPNFETIDTQMKTNANAGVGIANEIKTGTVHALTRITNDGDCAVFRFLATSNYQLGDSFTVDGVSVTALLPSGEPLGNGAYVIGSTVLCTLVETRLTVYATGGTATNSNALDGHPASYFLDASNEVFHNAGTDITATVTENAIKEVNGKFGKYAFEKMTIAINPVLVGQNVFTYFIAPVSKTGYKPIGVISLSVGDGHIMFGDFGIINDNSISADVYNPTATNITISTITATVVFERI